MNRTWGLEEEVIEIESEVRNILGRNPEGNDLYRPLVTVGQERGDPSHQNRRSRTPARNQNRNPGKTHQGRPSTVTCYNCQKRGHYASECYGTAYCPYHKKTGHNARDCKNRPRHRSQSQGRGRNRSQSPQIRRNRDENNDQAASLVYRH
ncbi:uncharacterized protein [Macrobrachium rosenbergii]|uniref:uncharacterized protein n=1 Tax=Macrobrachium rosenbergii TaxID=79674 RepID=UPI0034D5EA77